jgi:GDPmannose 4,6-dehydratase
MVLATGETTTVRAFCEMAFKHLGIDLEWEGKGEQEKGIVGSINQEKFENSTAQQLNNSTTKLLNVDRRSTPHGS